MTTIVLIIGGVVLAYFAWCALMRYIDNEIEFQLKYRFDDERSHQESVREIRDEMRRASQAMISTALEPRTVRHGDLDSRGR